MQMRLNLLSIMFLALAATAVDAAPKCREIVRGKTAASKPALVDRLRVAAVQFPLGERGNQQDFLAKVERFIIEAKENGAELVVFPELITTELVDWHARNESSPQQMQRIAREFSPRYERWLQQQAQSRGIAILGGTTPRIVEGERVVNTAILAMPDGKVHLQDKIFLTPEEKVWNWKPGSTLKVIDSPWGKTSMLICFDCEFPAISNMISKFKPELLLVPSWTSSMAGLNRVDWSARGQAVGQYAFVVKTGTVAGENATEPHFGQASIITPQETGWPTQTIEGTLNRPAIIYGDLDLAQLRRKKADSGFYPGKEQLERREPIAVEEE